MSNWPRIFEGQLKKLADWLAQQSNFSVLYVNYSDVIHNPQPHIEAICHFLDKDLQQDKMLGVIDPDLYRQRSS